MSERSEWAVQAGLPDGKILLDPGIGFGKSAAGRDEPDSVWRRLGLLLQLHRDQRLVVLDQGVAAECVQVFEDRGHHGVEVALP